MSQFPDGRNRDDKYLVAVVSGDLTHSRVRVEGQRLLIDSKGRCPKGYRLEVEVVTPHLTAVAVSNGGALQTVGTFPAQASIDAAVEQGGTIDIRSIAADDVDASVYSGGGIFATSLRSLSANIESGGIVTYWGDADVKKSVRDGGAVLRGKAADAQKPLAELNPALPPPPPVPPVPPLRH